MSSSPEIQAAPTRAEIEAYVEAERQYLEMATSLDSGLREVTAPLYLLFTLKPLRERMGDPLALLLEQARALEETRAQLAGLSPGVLAYAVQMQAELGANDRKGAEGSWRQCDPEDLWTDTIYHAGKMLHAMKHGEHGRVREFAADVGNMAMMTQDAYDHRLASGVVPPAGAGQRKTEILWTDTVYHACRMLYAMKHGEHEQVWESAATVENLVMVTRDAYDQHLSLRVDTPGTEEGPRSA